MTPKEQVYNAVWEKFVASGITDRDTLKSVTATALQLMDNMVQFASGGNLDLYVEMNLPEVLEYIMPIESPDTRRFKLEGQVE